MSDPKQMYYDKRGPVLVKNLRERHFDAWYCSTRQEAVEKALSLIPEGATVGWGGTATARQMGLCDAIHAGNYRAIDRDLCPTPEAREQAARDCLDADVFITSANALSLDGQMVNIVGNGNRIAAMIYCRGFVLVVAGMNKVCDTLEDALRRARTVAAPMNKQRFPGETPCGVTGTCGNCKSESCICNHIVVTRNCRPAGRIRFILVGEDLGF